ncbi:MAG TPA: hypothetical protein VJ927_12510 [Actinomycetota bacterium]|nr:hypothetical protein [Actinomycetota bacterium]
MKAKFQVALCLCVLVMVGVVTRLIQEAGLPECEAKVGRFQHPNCISPSADPWPQILMGLSAAVVTWFISSRVRPPDGPSGAVEL